MSGEERRMKRKMALCVSVGSPSSRSRPEAAQTNCGSTEETSPCTPAPADPTSRRPVLLLLCQHRTRLADSLPLFAQQEMLVHLHLHVAASPPLGALMRVCFVGFEGLRGTFTRAFRVSGTRSEWSHTRWLISVLGSAAFGGQKGLTLMVGGGRAAEVRQSSQRSDCLSDHLVDVLGYCWAPCTEHTSTDLSRTVGCRPAQLQEEGTVQVAKAANTQQRNSDRRQVAACSRSGQDERRSCEAEMTLPRQGLDLDLFEESSRGQSAVPIIVFIKAFPVLFILTLLLHQFLDGQVPLLLLPRSSTTSTTVWFLAYSATTSSSLLHCCELLLALVPLEAARPDVASCSQDKIPPVFALQLPQVSSLHHIALRPCGGQEGAGQRGQRAGGAEEFLVERRCRTRLHLHVLVSGILLHLAVVHPGKPQKGFRWQPCLFGAERCQRGAGSKERSVLCNFINLKLNT
ncbi:hypothetical protein F7725_009136 [Dissostichus mawsoni]|uniref:Uncharacterized protein n=1 Tax=Dissostichus mawsoni TaxID=36200 RepID=A0A7J5Z9A0_DISMA|nr:hypothetical protein F7725_009136 [Dissostichus mawsoni]